MNIKSIIKTLNWFIIRPNYYTEYFRLIIYSIKKTRYNNTKNEALKLCSSKAIKTNEAIYKITGKKIQESIKDIYKDIFSFADQKYSECPSLMGGAGDIDLIYWIAEYINATRIIETGVACGWSTLSLLLSTHRRKDGKILSIDMPYPGYDYDKYVGYIIPDTLKDNWELIKLPDRKGIPKALKKLKEIDMCHYDSDKKYPGRLWAYRQLWKKIKLGGVFISDDIGDNTAFHDFCAEINCIPIIVKSKTNSKTKYIGIILKDKRTNF